MCRCAVEPGGTRKGGEVEGGGIEGEEAVSAERRRSCSTADVWLFSVVE